jgi:protein-S-isoprenylcysteine O-methyltransferase Ste14
MDSGWDWFFVIPATVVWITGLILTGLDFFLLQNMIFKEVFVFIGAILGITGVTVRVYCRKVLGSQFSHKLQIIEDHHLITTGLYKYVRHPAYTGDLVVQIGIALFFSSIIGFLIMILLVPCFLYRISVEEKMLLDQFGYQYKEYQKNTKKLVPFIF